MHVSHEFLQTLAVVLGVAAVTTVLFQRLKQPVVFGYMLAGLIVGPHVPIPLVADEATVRTLSELGVILLMFSLGLEFHLRRLAQAGWTVVIIAALETSFMIWLGHEAGRALGWSPLASLYAGAALAISSTTIIVRAVADRGMQKLATDRVFGILSVEDLIAILLLAMLTPAGSTSGNMAGSLGMTVFRLAVFLVAISQLDPIVRLLWPIPVAMFVCRNARYECAEGSGIGLVSGITGAVIGWPRWQDVPFP